MLLQNRWASCRCTAAISPPTPLAPYPTLLLSQTLCCADLVPREVAEQWLKYFREELPAVAFKSSTQKQVRLC